MDRPARQLGFFDNMRDRPIVAGEWAYYEITGEIESDADLLNIGMMLQQEGTAWFDDVSLEILGDVETRAAAPPRAMAAQGVKNLVALTRLYGVIRYFHASDEAAAANWDALAIDSVDRVESAQNATELAARLNEVFQPVAPSLRVVTPGVESAPFVANGRTVVAWEHRGLTDTSLQGNIYSASRERKNVEDVKPPFPDPRKPLQLDLGDGVSATIPLAVFADDIGTLPRATAKPVAVLSARTSGDDRATRIANVIITWNALQHFYPYFDVVDVDWAAQLPIALQAAATDRDAVRFLDTLRRLVAALDDGHGSVSLPQASMVAALPVLWRVVDQKLVITTVGTGVEGVMAGDVVTAIDGTPATDAIRHNEGLVSGSTPQWRRHKALQSLRFGAPASSVVLTVEGHDGAARRVTLAREVQATLRENRPKQLSELKPNFWYVDLDRLTEEELAAAVESLSKAKGVVFDLRGYPRVGPETLRHLLAKPAQSARWNTPVFRYPDQQHVEFDTQGRWTLQPLAPKLPSNVVFLIDGRAVSYAESWMGIVEAYQLAEIVGEPTAGTNGNVTSVTLPGGYKVMFTGMKVLKHDGTKHHGVGIHPTVPSSPTISGIRSGRDEQLEKALALLEEKSR